MQTTSKILMIEPVMFGFNEETAENNYFQQKDECKSIEIQTRALQEFTNMVNTLRKNKIDIIVEKDTVNPRTPDSIFPNNWITTHSCGKIVLYPMFAPNRRAERRMDIIDNLQKKGFNVTQKIDITHYENENKYLEGTGSMILDRDNHIVYACLSERTDKDLLELFGRELDYKTVPFNAFQSVNGKRLPIYHTNVMMCIADKYAVICLNSIDKKSQRDTVVETIEKSGKKIIEISEEQMHRFAGNMLQVRNSNNENFLVMSQSAYQSLKTQQISEIENFNKIINIPIPTIEKYGGGSARCMMAEVFLSDK